MSGIVGITNIDGSPVDQILIKKMTHALAHRGPDGVGHWFTTSVGMGHLMFCTTPEAEREKQPWTDESGRLCVTFDGRVDNREELIKSLKSHNIQLRNDTDVEIVLQSYVLWEEGCAQKIIGDFAFALWDTRKQRLYCARDILGIRPFFYYTDGTRFIWGSELHQFFVDPSISREPNEGRIGEFLGGYPKSTDETLFHGIYRLPIGHYITVGRNGLRKRRYWDVDAADQIEYNCVNDYTDHFIDIFKEAILCRLRSNGPAGADLSGGLDSSSIACMIQYLRNHGLATENPFETFSMVFPGIPCDESNYIRDAVSKWDLCSNTGITKPAKRSLYQDIARRSLDFPDVPTGDICIWNQPWAAPAKGFRVVLTGEGGDEVVGAGSFSYYADLLKQGKLFELTNLAFRDWQEEMVLNPFVSIFRYGLKPLIPQSFRTLIKKKFFNKKKFAYIDPEFARRISLYDRLFAKPSCAGMCSIRRDFYESIVDGWSVKGYEMSSRMQAWLGLEYRHPLLDRRIIEFCLAIPYHQHRMGKLHKILLRNAMRDILPESIRMREDKTHFAYLFIDTLKIHGREEIFRSLRISDKGWIDPEKLAEMCSQAISQYDQDIPAYGLKMWQLWSVHGIDMWWRASFQTNNSPVYSEITCKNQTDS